MDANDSTRRRAVEMEQKANQKDRTYTTEEATALAATTARKPWSQWLLYGIVGISPIALAIYTLLNTNHWQDSRSFRLNTRDYVGEAIPFFVLAIALEVIVAAAKGKLHYYRLNDGVSSIFQGNFQSVTGIFIRNSVVFPYLYIHEHYKVLEISPDISWKHPMWWGMFIAIDFSYYWFHRLSHEWNALWAGHVVHHSSEEYNLTTALRQGVLQPVFSWMWYVWCAFFLPVELAVFHMQWNALYQFWIHTRVITKLPWIFEFVMNTPSHHRVHHGRNPQYIDKNYGGTLIIFDRMFGTFQPEEEEVKFGITHTLETWSPIEAQTHHLREMLDTTVKTSGILNKLRVWLDFGPAYNYILQHPHSLAHPPKFDHDRPKYDSQTPNIVMSLYALVHALGLILIGAIARKKADQHTQLESAVLVALTIFGMWTVSGLFDQKTWIKWVEVARLVVTVVVCAGFCGVYNLNSFVRVLMTGEHVAVTASVVVTVLSVVVLLLAYKPKQKKQ